MRASCRRKRRSSAFLCRAVTLARRVGEGDCGAGEKRLDRKLEMLLGGIRIG